MQHATHFPVWWLLVLQGAWMFLWFACSLWLRTLPTSGGAD